LKQVVADGVVKGQRPSPPPVVEGCSADPKTCVEEYYRNISTHNHRASYLLESRSFRAKTSFDEWYKRYWDGVISDEVIWSNEEFNNGKKARVRVEVKKTWHNPATGEVEVVNYVGTVSLIRENGVWFTNEFDFVSKDVYQAKQAEQKEREKERQISKIMDSVDSDISFYEVSKNPFKYRGKTVKWSGVVGSITERGKTVEMFVLYEDTPGDLSLENFYVEGEIDNSEGLVKESKVEVVGIVSGVEIGINRAGVKVEVPKLKLLGVRWH
jgi:hypothetical protein